MALDVARLVRHCLGRIPNGVTVRAASGACARGALDHADVPHGDGEGFTRLVAQRVVTLATADLVEVGADDEVTVRDAAGVETGYVVRDVRLLEDGLTKALTIVLR